MDSNQQFLQNLYDAFNKREIETLLAMMRPDVKWANGLEGGFVHGRDAVREYWTNQFKAIQPELETLKFETDERGRNVVIIHLMVKDLQGNVLADAIVHQIFTIEDGLVSLYEIGETDTINEMIEKNKAADSTGGNMNSSTENNTATFADQDSAFQPTTVKGKYASVGDLKMYYETHGKGRPLVLLHGAFMSADVYPSLAEGRRLIAVDLQGHGRTADIDRPFTFEQMADDVAALLKQLEIEQTDAFGYSMGAKVGLALAIRHPKLVRRLAIYGATYKSFEESLPPDLLGVFKQITPETFAPEALKESYERLSPDPNWIGLAEKILESIKDFQGFSLEQMKAIKAEVFLSAGDHKDINLEHLVEMHKLIPNSQLAVFPNTDHVVMMTNPNKVLVQVKEFLDNGFETASETK